MGSKSTNVLLGKTERKTEAKRDNPSSFAWKTVARTELVVEAVVVMVYISVCGMQFTRRVGIYTSYVPVHSRTALPGRRRHFHTDDQNFSELARSDT